MQTADTTSSIVSSSRPWDALKQETKGSSRDIIVVTPCHPSRSHQVACSDFVVVMPRSYFKSTNQIVTVKVNRHEVEEMQMVLEESGRCRFAKPSQYSPYRPCSATLEKLVSKNDQNSTILCPGHNSISFQISSEKLTIKSHIHLWSSSDSIIVCDIDGTITKSNVYGFVNFSHVHQGVCRFFSEFTEHSESSKDNISPSSTSAECTNSKARILYLTARPMTLYGRTRKFLTELEQIQPKQAYQKLPPGPIFCQEGSLANALYSEVVAKDGHIGKSVLLKNQLVNPFLIAGRALNTRLFIAGFGNMITDVMAYELAGIHHDDIYIINKKSKIVCMSQVFCNREIDEYKESKEDDEEISAPVICCMVSNSWTVNSSVMRSDNSISPQVSTSMLFSGVADDSLYNSYSDPRLMDDVKQKLKRTFGEKSAND